MALSTTAKAGIGGLGTVSVGVPTTYVVYDKYFSDSLYAVEKEVISKEVKLKVEDTESSGNRITVNAESNVNEKNDKDKLIYGHSWSCVITVHSGQEDTETTTINRELKGRLSLLDTQQKIDLIRACSKDKEKALKHEVKGRLKLNVSGAASDKSYKFEGHEELDYLLDFFFKAVEWETISKNVLLEIDSTYTEQNKVKIKAQANDSSGSSESNKLTHNHSWSCEITVVTDPSGTENNETTSLKSKLNISLPKLTSGNKYKLIKGCAKTRKTTPEATDDAVTGTLTVNVKGADSSKTYLFSNNKVDLGFLVKS